MSLLFEILQPDSDDKCCIQIQMVYHIRYCSTDAGLQQNLDKVTKHNSSRQKFKKKTLTPITDKKAFKTIKYNKNKIVQNF